MFGLGKEIVVFDCEWTSWEGSLQRHWYGPGEHRELVQIGAVKVETETFEEFDNWQILIKPKINPVLSPYFIELSGMNQERLDREGVPFPIALAKFSRWCGSHPLYSWTLTDFYVLVENCRIRSIDELPFKFSRFFDIREVFWQFGVAAETYSSGNIPTAFGKSLTRKTHSGLNDARTIVDALKELKLSKTQKIS